MCGQQKQPNDPRNNQHNPQYANYWALLTRKRHMHIQHSPGTLTTGLRERGNDTGRSTGRSGRHNAATRRNMRRGEGVTVQTRCCFTRTRRHVTQGVLGRSHKGSLLHT